MAARRGCCMGRRAKVRLCLRTDDLARMFGVTSRTITRWIASGRLPLTGDPEEDLQTLHCFKYAADRCQVLGRRFRPLHPATES